MSINPGAVFRFSEPILRVQGLTKIYGGKRVLDDVSFELYAGEVLTLLGPSGCGKSTTLRLIAGLDQPDAGEIRVRGRLVASAACHVMVSPEERNVGMVFQSYAIWPHLTVAENIGYPLKVRRVDRATITGKVADMIRLVKLDGLGGSMPGELSGGQQQRVALARALIYEPDFLLLDEPLSNLDSVLRKEMRAQLKELQSRLGTTIIYVTHDQDEAMSLSSRLVVMNRGVVEQVGEPDTIYAQPATPFVQDFVGRTVRLRGVTEGDAPLRVRIGSNVIELAGDEMPRGTAVELATRPEDIRLLVSSDSEGNCIAGEILEVTSYGNRIECVIGIDGPQAQVVVVDAEKRQGVTPGDRVCLHIDAARVRLWPL